MTTIEQTLNLAVDELRCINATTPTTLADLRALAIARDCVDELISAAVNDLRTGSSAAHSWAAIAQSLGTHSAEVARKRWKPDVADSLVASFWATHVEQFAWSFLPASFLHALYLEWIAAAHSHSPPMSPETFTRRLKPIATSSGQWQHLRLRAASSLATPEPLLEHVRWRPSFDGRAIWGFRRMQ